MHAKPVRLCICGLSTAIAGAVCDVMLPGHCGNLKARFDLEILSLTQQIGGLGEGQAE